MSQRKYIVRDASIYCRPDGGRLSEWHVVDRKTGEAVATCSTRREARETARLWNTNKQPAAPMFAAHFDF